MTDGHESDFLVTVRAQVMTRDESTEGWLPLAGGGLANVSIRKRSRLSPGAAGHEYIIYGQRISDQSVILSCVINRDLKYYKVMPTFHHWRAGKQRNGLTFQTAADARAFDIGVVKAYNELIDGIAKNNPSIICPLTKYDSVGEDDVFMTLDLPVESEAIQKSHSSPEGSEKSHSQKSLSERFLRESEIRRSGDINENSDRIHYISSEKSTAAASAPLDYRAITPLAKSNTDSLPTAAGKASTTTNSPINVNTVSSIEPPPVIAPSENYSYVTLTAVHDYNYTVVDQPAAAQVLNARRESISALKKHNALESHQAFAAAAQQSPISAAIFKEHQQQQQQQQQYHHLYHPHHHGSGLELMKKNQRIRCRYCHELYSEEWNRKGACEFAPDCFRTGLDCISCMGCARCMVYHCMSDAEGETTQHPCECNNDAGCTKRWIGLTLLSLVVPCLWCYPPLRACHLMGVSCGICGGKHKPQV